jgi:hypothetical protein
MGAIFTNFAAGTITDSPLTNAAGTINSANFASLPVVATPDFLFLVLDPAATAGVPEVVKVTAHTIGATTVTVTRGQQTTQGGSVARQHNGGTTWVHALTALDLDSFPYRIVAAKGDMIVGTAAGTVARLAIGGEQSFARADSTQTSGIRWGNLGTVPVHATSGARDAAMPTPGVGQGVYVKSNDVNEGLYFNNSAGGTPPGVYRPAWNLPWGHVAEASASTTDQTGITAAADVTGCFVTFTAVANRRYRVWAQLGSYFQSTTAGILQLFLADGSNTTLPGTNTLVTAIGVTNNNRLNANIASQSTSPAAGSVTYKLRGGVITGGAMTIENSQSSARIWVEDIGPSGAPA